MKTEEAIQMIRERISELLEDKNIQTQMVEQKKAGKGKKEIQEWLINIAIASLYGQEEK